LYSKDTLNSVGHEDQQLQWSQGHNYYKALSLAKKMMNLISITLRTSLVSCVPKVIDFKELIQWCTKKFNSENRIVQLQGKQPISLAPLVFTRILHLPKPTIRFKGEEDNGFLK
jgi:hypothetical protein